MHYVLQPYSHDCLTLSQNKQACIARAAPHLGSPTYYDNSPPHSRWQNGTSTCWLKSSVTTTNIMTISFITNKRRQLQKTVLARATYIGLGKYETIRYSMGRSRIRKGGLTVCPNRWKLGAHEQSHSSSPKLCNFVKITMLPIFTKKMKKVGKRNKFRVHKMSLEIS